MCPESRPLVSLSGGGIFFWWQVGALLALQEDYDMSQARIQRWVHMIHAHFSFYRFHLPRLIKVPYLPGAASLAALCHKSCVLQPRSSHITDLERTMS